MGTMRWEDQNGVDKVWQDDDDKLWIIGSCEPRAAPPTPSLSARFWRWVASRCAPYLATDLHDALKKVL